MYIFNLIILIWFYFFQFILSLQALCGFPGKPAFGSVLENYSSSVIYKENDIVNYVCDKDYFLKGRGSRKCLSNGTWSNHLPICELTLNKLGNASSPNPLNPYLPYLAIDNDLTSCFYTNRSKPRVWMVDMLKEWKVISVAITMPFASSEHYFTIYVSNEGIATDNQARCSSFTGMFATQTLIILCKSGGVKGRYLHINDNNKRYEYFGLCEVKIFVEKKSYKCGQVEQPLNSYPIESHHDDYVTYSCFEGYQLIGPSERYCQSDGQWSGEQPICKEIICNSLNLTNGKVQINGSSNEKVVVSSQAIFNCDSGYNLIGSINIICLSNGKWSDKMPICKAVDCGHPPNHLLLNFGKFVLLNQSTEYQALAQLKCNANLEPLGTNSIIECQKNGKWSKLYATCNHQFFLSSANFLDYQSKLKAESSSPIVIMILTIIILLFIILLLSLFLIQKFIQKRNQTVKLVTWKPDLPCENSLLKDRIGSLTKRLGITRGLQVQEKIKVSSRISQPSCQITKLKMEKMIENRKSKSALTSNERDQQFLPLHPFASTIDLNAKNSQFNSTSGRSVKWTTIEIEKNSKTDKKSQIFSARF